MPTQTNSGAGAVQIGRIGRMRDQKVINNNVSVTNNYVFPSTQPPLEPAHGGMPRMGTAQQHQLLMELIDLRPFDSVVFDFMGSKFGTREVSELSPQQVRVASRFAQTVRESHMPPDPSDVGLHEVEGLERRLSEARADLFKLHWAFYVNWPSALMVLFALSMAGYVLWSIGTGRWLQSGEGPTPAMFVPTVASLVGLSIWLNNIRRPLRYVMAHRRAEVRELERAVALQRMTRR